MHIQPTLVCGPALHILKADATVQQLNKAVMQ